MTSRHNLHTAEANLARTQRLIDDLAAEQCGAAQIIELLAIEAEQGEAVDYMTETLVGRRTW